MSIIKPIKQLPINHPLNLEIQRFNLLPKDDLNKRLSSLQIIMQEANLVEKKVPNLSQDFKKSLVDKKMDYEAKQEDKEASTEKNPSPGQSS